MKQYRVRTLIITSICIVVLGITSLTSCITFDNPTNKATTTAMVTTPSQVVPVDPGWTPLPAENPVDVQRYSMADVVEMVKPAVVAISTEVISYDFFNRPYTQEGAGSGWIIDPNGIIVTNNHVVEGANTITVTLDNGTSYTADKKSVFTDSLNDLAIIKISATNLPALKTGDTSKLRLGDWVIAIGNALGQGTRVTEGIVSRKDVSLPLDQTQTLYNLLETSAAINPGNSGGPLVNLFGEVVGITSAKITSVGVEGMGYAISINTATPIIHELVTKGYVTRPYLGVSLYTVDQMAVSYYKLKVEKGIVLTKVSPGSPADKAGLKEGDVIVILGGVAVETVQDLTQALHASEIGKPLEIRYWRGDIQETTTVIPIETPRIS